MRPALLDHRTISGRFGRRRPYRVLLGPAAVVSSPARRDELNTAALANLPGRGAWLVGHPDELGTELQRLPAGTLHAVHRLPIGEIARATEAVPTVVHDEVLGYLGARDPRCGWVHVDHRRVHARERGGVVAFSLPASRRPVLLDLVPDRADTVRLAACPRHDTPILRAR
ncbi:MAG TPA: hypothetical protein VF163_02765, partial [Micromonosporaceae bacterium]